MAISSKSLQSLSNDHIVECYRLAMQMELDEEFIFQLKLEIDSRNLTPAGSYKEFAFTTAPCKDLNATG